MPMNKPEPIIEIGTIEVERAQVDLWKTGVLAPLWAQRFPELFREHDLDLARAQGHLGYHFIEWLAAIVLHHTSGYHSAGSYEFRHRPTVVEKLLSAEVRALVADRTQYSAQGPDLLMYAPDLSDWFFCEVKGPDDSMREVQCNKFAALAELSRKSVRLLRFTWAPRRNPDPGASAHTV